jgi:hypothetical protein
LQQRRADLFRWLCVDTSASKLVDPRGIRISHFVIDGDLDLYSAEIPFPLEFKSCRLEGFLNLNLATLPRFELDGCWINALSAERVTLRGSLFLRHTRCEGTPIKLNGATVGGNLVCAGSQFSNPRRKDISESGIALAAEAIQVGGGVYLRGDFRAVGTIRLFNARIEGNIECDGAALDSGYQPPDSTNTALSLEAANVKGSVFLRKGFQAKGLVNLDFATVGGNLDCNSSRFNNPSVGHDQQTGTAFSGRSTKIEGSVSFRSLNQEQERCVILGAIQMPGARIGGPFDCDGSQFANLSSVEPRRDRVALNLESATIGGPLLLRNRFHGLGRVNLYNAEIAGDFQCDGVFENPAVENSNGSGVALNAAAIKVGGSIVLRGSAGTGQIFVARGMVNMFRVRVQRNLECDGGHFENAAVKDIGGSGLALIANGIDVGGDAFLRKSFQAVGLVSLYSARIGGDLDCDGASFTNPAKDRDSPGGIALNVAFARISGSIYCRSGVPAKGRFLARGRVLLTGSQIEGNVDCAGGMFLNPAQLLVANTGNALQASRLNVSGDVLLRNSFHAEGSVLLNNCRIGGDLNCEGGEFHNHYLENVTSDGLAIGANHSRISGHVLLRNSNDGFRKLKFSAKAATVFDGAQIDGNLECDGGSFENPPIPTNYAAEVLDVGVPLRSIALRGEMTKIGGDVRLRNGFCSQGVVSFAGAHIGGSVDCRNGSFINSAENSILANSDELVALDTSDASVSRDMLLSEHFDAKAPVRLRKIKITGRLETQGGAFVELDCADASATAIVDGVDDEKWIAGYAVNLDGFTYQRVSRESPQSYLDGLLDSTLNSGEIRANIPHRLKWLRLQNRFTRQPYLRLAKILKDAGDDKGYRRVCIGMETRALEYQSWWRQAGGYLLRSTIGYGYASQLAIYWILGLILLGTAVYWHGADTMVPTQSDAYREFRNKKDTPPYYGRFHAFVYSVDNSFPLIKLGVQEKWVPAESSNIASSTETTLDKVTTSAIFLRYFRLAQSVAGWILTTLFAVGVTGIIRKD